MTDVEDGQDDCRSPIVPPAEVPPAERPHHYSVRELRILRTRWPVVANALDLREASELLMELRRLKFARQRFDDATRLPRS